MNYKIKPWAHQLTAIERAKDLRDFAFFCEPGTGKSCMLINTLRHKFNVEKMILKTLILCPPVVISNWANEWKMHSSLDSKLIVQLTGSQVQRLKTFQSSNPRSVFISNYEITTMQDLFEEIKDWGPEVIVADESHRIKNYASQRAKRCIELAKDARHRYILTGSPILNSPSDIFSQFKFLDGGATLGSNFFAFRARYFRDENCGMPRHKYFPKWVPMDDTPAQINYLIEPLCAKAKKSECLDLPPLVKTTIKVPLGPGQKEAYESMKKEFIAFVNGNACTAMLAIVKALRLQQIASGYMPTVDQTGESFTARFKGNPRIMALRELLEEHTPHSKVIVWASWAENYKDIRAVFEDMDLPYVELTGETPASKRTANVDAFNNDPSIRCLLGHPGSGGIGVNLISSNVAIYYSRTFSLEHAIQSEARNFRGGSEIHESIQHIDLVAEGTIDEFIQTKLAEKVEIGEKILGNLTQELMKGQI